MWKPSQNRLLAALPDADFERLRPYLVLMEMSPGRVLYEAATELAYVYFPVTAVVSLLNVTADGATAEVAVVGNDGLVGIHLFLGCATTPSQAVVLSAGIGYRLPASELIAEANRAGAMFQLLLRYTQTLIVQMAQTAGCNRHHTLRQQLCRWLLLSLDRLPGDELVMTQQLIAHMLGVRRVGISEEARRLQAEGVIRYHRGRITVLDRAQLQAISCECYAVVRKECDRLLPWHVAR